ncbi:MAG: flavin reductase family protein [Gordonia sp. (in: high G+C Gram-positive bacteria)]
MANVASPVSIVTTFDGETPFGTTVSAFSSLSMNPPMVLVCLDRRSDTLASVQASGRFGLNILGSNQTDTAMTFAKKGTDKFHGTHWDVHDGLPRVAEAPGWVACTVTDFIEGGDHLIAVGAVETAELTDGRPLVYHRRLFGTHAPQGS